MLCWSDECYRILGCDPAQGIPSHASALERIHPDDRTRIAEWLSQDGANSVESKIECRLILPDGNLRYIRTLARPAPTVVGSPVEYIGTVIDVMEQKRSDDEHEAYLWFLESMDRINRAIQKTNDVEGMTRGVLEEALTILNCDRAWLVYPCDPDATACHAVMEHMNAECPGAFALGQTLAVDAQTAASMRDILRTQEAVVDSSVPTELSRRFNIQSTIAMAVRPKGDRPYLFGLHQCSRSRTWTNVERRLFEEIGRRLEVALASALAHRNLLASEEALRTSEERLRTLVDHATDAIFLYDDNGVVLDVNRQACGTLGYAREELIGMNTSQFDRDIKPGNAEWLEQQLHDVGSVTFSAERQRKDGSHFPVEVRVRAFRRGGRLFAIALASDITDRRRREQRLLVQFAVTRILSEAGSIDEAALPILREMCEALEWTRGALWRVDPEAGRLVRVQVWPPVTVTRIDAELGSEAEDFESRLTARVWPSGIPEWVPDISLDEEIQQAESVLNEGIRAVFAFPITFRSNVLGVIELTSPEIRRIDPELMQTMNSVGSQVGQFVERTRAEDALRHAREKLAQASRMATVAELSASIAHEINQPLQSVVANGQACRRWLAAASPNIEKARLSAEAIIRDGYATAEVIGRIRALFQRTAPVKIELDINTLVLQVCTLMADDIHRNTICVETRLAQDMPTIRADAVQIQQVIVNLVRNAIEALVATTVQPKSLLIRSRCEGGDVVVDVQDEGLGPVNLEMIFEPFTTTKATGMGMGLAICRSIVEAHCGRIWVVRNENRGVTFSFSLPTHKT